MDKNKHLTNYRSGLEEKLAGLLTKQGVAFAYEQKKISYTIPESKHTYTPDFILPNGIILEVKGKFPLVDRKKHLWVREQNPELDIRFVFSNKEEKINPKSKTTYAAWCEKNNFFYCEMPLPESWLQEQNSNNN